MGKLYKSLCKSETIWRAWSVVLENGRASRSPRTRAEIESFLAVAPKSIQNILWRLQRNKFEFAPAHGVAIPKKNKIDKRPIVLAPIANRIVQRAILDVVQSIPAIKEKLQRRHNFGGIEDVGVPDAVKKVYEEARRHQYFVRTDIKAFFDKIPRDKAISLISRETGDAELNQLVTAATTTELDNISKLGRDGELFPLENIGVAQGSSLSPLLCNLLLCTMDERMNDKGIVCVRYIDDFILIGPDRKKTLAALKSARKLLHELSPELDCYDPRDRPDKAEEGLTSSAFSFLGCEIRTDSIRPSRQAWTGLLERIRRLASDAYAAAATPTEAITGRKSYADTLQIASNVIRGWGNTYSFCTDDRLMADIDRQLDRVIDEFSRNYLRLIAKRVSPKDKRRLTGVFLLSDCKRDLDIRNLVKQHRT